MPLPPSQPTSLPLAPGDFHRLGFATSGTLEETARWFSRVLGAATLTGGSIGLHDFQMGAPEAHGRHNDSQAPVKVMWLGGKPIALFTATEPTSGVATFLDRYGPGIHSLAWTVDDLWATDALLRRDGVRVTGTDIPGRHFFMHPRDTAGIFIEWTDSIFAQDPRDGAPPPPAPEEAVVVVRDLAWITAVVRDAAATAETLTKLVDCTRLAGNGAGAAADAEVVDLAISDLVLRLVAPRDPASPLGTALATRGPRLYSACLGVDNLALTRKSLAAENIEVLSEGGGTFVTDPADTLGLVLEWADTYVAPPTPSA
ncbi:VOC family protein [Nocardioides sp.]|uniref:VOC family protein n=1 Tax=Nocardioides sp. TaxID=35761 RepID=UPI002737706B|nr:VOC family protein [Nocardioides sp.]MDP3890776.1 VOC family protein [Nocardioides sp.]